MENPTLPRVYVLPRADALLPAKGGSEHTSTITPPHLCASTLFIWGVLQLLSCSIPRRSSGLEVCGQGRALKAPALGGLGQACEEGLRGRGGASFSISSQAWFGNSLPSAVGCGPV